MPYHIEKQADMFEVVDDAGKVAGKHPTRKQATEQLRALYANVPEAKEIDEMEAWMSEWVSPSAA